MFLRQDTLRFTGRSHARAGARLGKIRPNRFATHGALAEVYFLLGDARHAREHRDKAAWLRKNRPE